MNRLITISSIVCFLFFGLFGCDKLGLPTSGKIVGGSSASNYTPKGPIVAKVNGMPISLEDLDYYIEITNSQVPDTEPQNKIKTKEQKIAFLKDTVVRRVLLYQEGLRKGIDKQPDVAGAIEKIKMGLVLDALTKEEMKNITVSSKEVEDYYNAYKDQLKEPEERNIREILLPNEQDARDVLILLLQGTDFATLAKERSKAPSAKDGGDLGFISRDKKFKQFDAVAFSDSLEVGKTSSIFKGPDGYYIIKLEAKRGGKQKSLSDMWDDLKAGLTFVKQQQALDDMINKLNAKAKIDINEGQIK
jgi:peptidyl-prolyl cis-trans isomerase C